MNLSKKNFTNRIYHTRVFQFYFSFLEVTNRLANVGVPTFRFQRIFENERGPRIDFSTLFNPPPRIFEPFFFFSLFFLFPLTPTERTFIKNNIAFPRNSRRALFQEAATKASRRRARQPGEARGVAGRARKWRRTVRSVAEATIPPAIWYTGIWRPFTRQATTCPPRITIRNRGRRTSVATRRPWTSRVTRRSSTDRPRPGTRRNLPRGSTGRRPRGRSTRDRGIACTGAKRIVSERISISFFFFFSSKNHVWTTVVTAKIDARSRITLEYWVNRCSMLRITG